MNLKWFVLPSLGLVMTCAFASQPIVLDNESIGDPLSTTATAAPQPSPSADTPNSATNSSEDQVQRDRILKGRKYSLKERVELEKAALKESNKKEGEDFLATNKAKKDVVTLPTGVQYRVLRAGKGIKPTEQSKVMCRYKGYLVDGSTFDKTDERRPSLMNVAGFVPGLREAVKLMPTGSKWEIVVPPELGFGPVGNRGVGGNAVVIYQMEILSVKI
jgi:FKBP-type peptidyl-prolyl cis-trans isomerase FklB